MAMTRAEILSLDGPGLRNEILLRLFGWTVKGDAEGEWCVDATGENVGGWDRLYPHEDRDDLAVIEKSLTLDQYNRYADLLLRYIDDHAQEPWVAATGCYAVAARLIEPIEICRLLLLSLEPAGGGEREN